MLDAAPWLIEQLADNQIREALRDAESRRLMRQAHRARDGWLRQQAHHVGRQLGHLLVELGVGMIQRALFQSLPATGQPCTDPCRGASL